MTLDGRIGVNDVIVNGNSHGEDANSADVTDLELQLISMRIVNGAMMAAQSAECARVVHQLESLLAQAVADRDRHQIPFDRSSSRQPFESCRQKGPSDKNKDRQQALPDRDKEDLLSQALADRDKEDLLSQAFADRDNSRQQAKELTQRLDIALDSLVALNAELDSGHGPRVDALKWSFKREWRREHEEAIRALQRKFEDELDRMKHYYDKKIAHLSGNHKDVSSDEERGSTVRQLDGVAKSGALKTGVKSGEYIQRIHSEQVEKVPTDERLDGMEQVQVKIKDEHFHELKDIRVAMQEELLRENMRKLEEMAGELERVHESKMNELKQRHSQQVEKLLADKDELNARILVLEKELCVARSEVDDLSVVVLDLSSPVRAPNIHDAQQQLEKLHCTVAELMAARQRARVAMETSREEALVVPPVNFASSPIKSSSPILETAATDASQRRSPTGMETQLAGPQQRGKRLTLQSAQDAIAEEMEMLRARVRTLQQQIDVYEHKAPSTEPTPTRVSPTRGGAAAAAKRERQQKQEAEAKSAAERDLRASLAELSERYEAAIAASEAANAKRIEDLQRSHAQELANFHRQRGESAGQVLELDEQIKAELAREITEARSECARQVEEKRRELAAEHERLIAEAEAKMATEFAERLHSLEETHLAELQSAKQALEDAESKHAATIRELEAKRQESQQQSEDDVDAKSQPHKAEKVGLAVGDNALPAVVGGDHADGTGGSLLQDRLADLYRICADQRAKIDLLDRLIADLVARRSDERRASEERLKELEEEHAREIGALRLDALALSRDNQIAALLASHEEAVAQLKEDHAREIADIRREAAENEERLQKQVDLALEKLQHPDDEDAAEKDAAVLEDKVKAAVEAVREEHVAEVARLQQAAAEREDLLQQQLREAQLALDNAEQQAKVKVDSEEQINRGAADVRVKVSDENLLGDSLQNEIEVKVKSTDQTDLICDEETNNDEPLGTVLVELAAKHRVELEAVRQEYEVMIRQLQDEELQLKTELVAKQSQLEASREELEREKERLREELEDAKALARQEIEEDKDQRVEYLAQLVHDGEEHAAIDAIASEKASAEIERFKALELAAIQREYETQIAQMDKELAEEKELTLKWKMEVQRIQLLLAQPENDGGGNMTESKISSSAPPVDFSESIVTVGQNVVMAPGDFDEPVVRVAQHVPAASALPERGFEQVEISSSVESNVNNDQLSGEMEESLIAAVEQNLVEAAVPKSDNDVIGFEPADSEEYVEVVNVGELKRLLAEREEVIKQLEDELQVTISKADDRESALAEMVLDMEMMRVTLRETEGILRDHEQRCQLQKGEIETLMARCIVQEEITNGISKEVQKRERELERVNAILKEKTEELETAHKVVDDRDSRLQNIMRQVRSVSDHLTDADLSSEDVWAKVKQELEELRGACNDKEERIRLLESQVKRQEDTLEEARQDCDRKYEELAELKRQCGDKESELSAVLNQVATLREQLTKAEEDIAMASAAEVERLREECRKKEEKIGELEAQSRQIETLLDKLRAALAEKEREAQTVKSELEEREATLNDIMDKLRMALGEEVAEGLGQQRKADLGEIHRLQLEVEILKGELQLRDEHIASLSSAMAARELERENHSQQSDVSPANTFTELGQQALDTGDDLVRHEIFMQQRVEDLQAMSIGQAIRIAELEEVIQDVTEKLQQAQLKPAAADDNAAGDLIAEKNGLQRTNERLLRLLSETVRRSTAVEERINRALGQPSSPSVTSEAADGDFSVASDEGLDNSLRQHELIFHGPDLDPDCEALVLDPYQRLQHSVQNLLDVIANSQAQVTEAVVAQQHMQDQLQQRTSEMERLSYEIDELHEQLDQETKARLTLVEELARTEESLQQALAAGQRQDEVIHELNDNRKGLTEELSLVQSQLAALPVIDSNDSPTDGSSSLKDEHKTNEDEARCEQVTQSELRNVIHQLEDDLMAKSQDEAALLTKVSELQAELAQQSSASVTNDITREDREELTRLLQEKDAEIEMLQERLTQLSNSNLIDLSLQGQETSERSKNLEEIASESDDKPLHANEKSLLSHSLSSNEDEQADAGDAVEGEERVAAVECLLTNSERRHSAGAGQRDDKVKVSDDITDVESDQQRPAASGLDDNSVLKTVEQHQDEDVYVEKTRSDSRSSSSSSSSSEDESRHGDDDRILIATARDQLEEFVPAKDDEESEEKPQSRDESAEVSLTKKESETIDRLEKQLCEKEQVLAELQESCAQLEAKANKDRDELTRLLQEKDAEIEILQDRLTQFSNPNLIDLSLQVQETSERRKSVEVIASESDDKPLHAMEESLLSHSLGSREDKQADGGDAVEEEERVAAVECLLTNSERRHSADAGQRDDKVKVSDDITDVESDQQRPAASGLDDNSVLKTVEQHQDEDVYVEKIRSDSRHDRSSRSSSSSSSSSEDESHHGDNDNKTLIVTDRHQLEEFVPAKDEGESEEKPQSRDESAEVSLTKKESETIDGLEKQLCEKEQVLAELRESCAQLEAKANDAADRLKSQEESIAKLQAILAEKEEELNRLASQADEGQGHEEVKDDAHSDKSQVEIDMAKDNRESSESYKEVVMELQQLQHNCDKLSADLREKAAELRAEERRIRELEQSEAILVDELEASRRSAANQKKALEAAEKTIGELQERLAAADVVAIPPVECVQNEVKVENGSLNQDAEDEEMVVQSKQAPTLAADVQQEEKGIGRQGDVDRLRDAWQQERAILLANIHSLKTLLAETHRAKNLTEGESEVGDWRGELVRAVGDVFAKEGEGLLTRARTQRATGELQSDIADSLEQLIDEQTSRQTQAIQQLFTADRESMLGEIAALRAKVKDSEEAVEREKQAAEDERRRADTDQLRKIKQLEHQCQLAEYRLHQEKVIADDLGESVAAERRSATELQQQLMRERQLTIDAEEEAETAKQALETARRELDIERERLVAASSELEEERQRRAEAVEALRAEMLERDRPAASKSRSSPRDDKLTAELAAEVRRRQEAEERVKVIQQQLAEVASHQTAALDTTRRALETEKQLCDQLKKALEEEQCVHAQLAADMKSAGAEREAVAELRAALDEERSRLTDIQRQLDLEHEKVRRLDALLKVKDAEGHLDDVTRQLEVEKSTTRHLKTELSAMQERHAALQVELSRFQHTSPSSVGSASDLDLSGVTSDSRRSRHRPHETEVERESRHARKLEARLRKTEDDRRDLVAKVDRLSAKVKDGDAVALQLQASLAEELQQHAATRRRLEDALAESATAASSAGRRAGTYSPAATRGLSASPVRNGHTPTRPGAVRREVLTVREAGGGISALHIEDIASELRLLATRLQDELDRFHAGNYYDERSGAEFLTIDRRLNNLARDLRHLHDTVTLHMAPAVNVVNDKILMHNTELSSLVARLAEEKRQLRGMVRDLGGATSPPSQQKVVDDSSSVAASDGKPTQQDQEQLLRSKVSDLLRDNNELSHRLADVTSKLTGLQQQREKVEEMVGTGKTVAGTVAPLGAGDTTTEQQQQQQHSKDKMDRLYGKFVRAETHRQALVYQKNYLLTLIHGFRVGEEKTLALIASLGAHPHPDTLSKVKGSAKSSRSSQWRPLATFRAGVRVVIAVGRLQANMRKWKKLTTSKSANASSKVTAGDNALITSAATRTLKTSPTNAPVAAVTPTNGHSRYLSVDHKSPPTKEHSRSSSHHGHHRHHAKDGSKHAADIINTSSANTPSAFTPVSPAAKRHMPPSSKEDISVSRASSSIGAAVPASVGSTSERRRPTVTTTDHAVSDLYLRRLEMMEQRLSRVAMKQPDVRSSRSPVRTAQPIC